MNTTKTVQQRLAAHELLDFLEAHPDKNNQSVWARIPEDPDYADDPWVRDWLPITADTCGTVACAAGWTVLLHGHTIAGSYVVDLPVEIAEGVLGRASYVPYVAARILGLTVEERNLLFYEAQDLDDVRDAICYIFGPRPADNV